MKEKAALIFDPINLAQTNWLNPKPKSSNLPQIPCNLVDAMNTVNARPNLMSCST